MIIIEKPKVKDIKDIQDVFYKTWLATYPNKPFGVTVMDIEEKYKDRFSKKAIEKRKKDIVDVSENKLFLVAKDNNKVIGVCKLKKEKIYNELCAIYILPKYQRKGIGKRFWNKTLEFFKDEKDIVVKVAIYNNKAINFYKKIGFKDTNKRFRDKKFKMPISGSCILQMELVLKSRSSC
jgi:ribosomal protein S18 acetylase RimI-like enzyme